MAVSTLRKVDDAPVEVGVSDEKRTEVAEALSGFLASTYTLYMKSLYYHWNVTGPNFRSLHALFEEHYQNLHEAGDAVAERIRALGHFTPGTYREYAKLSIIHEDEALPSSPEHMLKQLLQDHQTCSKEARKVLKTAEKAGDEVTVDLMVNRMTWHEDAAWMLRSLLG